MFGQVSPLTYAVAVTAFIAASIFVVADAFRTLDEIADTEALMDRLGAAQPLLARQFVASAFEPVVSEVNTDASLTGLVQRGAAAYGLAFLFGVAAFRRRPCNCPSPTFPMPTCWRRSPSASRAGPPMDG